jgi:hypothetical protein
MSRQPNDFFARRVCLDGPHCIQREPAPPGLPYVAVYLGSCRRSPECFVSWEVVGDYWDIYYDSYTCRCFVHLSRDSDYVLLTHSGVRYSAELLCLNHQAVHAREGVRE